MTTVIVTGVPVVHAAVRYHRRLGRYMVELSGDGVTVEFVLTAEQVRQLLAEFRQQGRKVGRGPGDEAEPGSSEREQVA